MKTPPVIAPGALGALALALVVSGCSATAGLQGALSPGRATASNGGEFAMKMGMGMGKDDSMGVQWSTELGYVEGGRQPKGAFLYRSGIDAIGFLSKPRMIVRSGPRFGFRAGGAGEPQYTLVGMQASMVPALMRKQNSFSNAAAQLGVGAYFAIDWLFNGQRTRIVDGRAQPPEGVPGDLVITAGISIEFTGVDLFSRRRYY